MPASHPTDGVITFLRGGDSASRIARLFGLITTQQGEGINMLTKLLRCLCLAAALVAMALVATPHANAAPAFGADRFLVHAQKGADLAQLQKSIVQAGGKVIK